MKSTLQTLIEKHKTYYVNPDLTEANFPVPKKIETKGGVLVTIDRTMTSQEALDLIKSKGLRPANLYELLKWKGLKDMKRSSWVVALGQTCIDADGHRRVPDVDCDSDGDFHWGLGSFGHVWSDDDAFFCFCDESLAPQNLSQPSSSLTLENAIKKVKEAGYRITKEI